MSRRRLTEEEKQDISNKEWKKTPVFTSDERVAHQAKNLTGPKTAEGKARSLANLRVGRNKGEGPKMSHGGYIMRLLDQDEQEMYAQFRKEFEDDYDINDSADQTILELVLIDKVRLYRVMRAQFEKPSIDIDRPLNEITNRLNKNLDALGALRKQRLQQDERATAISIGTVSQQFFKELMNGKIKLEREQAEEEEIEFLARKKEREALTIVDAEYEVIDDDKEEREDS
jgi:hypothetical protein